MKLCIAVAARKGGVGKTTLSCGLGSVLASQNQRVLIIDLDPQSNAGYVLGTDPTAPGTAKLLSGQMPQPQAASPNLYVLPGGPELSGHNILRLDPEDLADAIQLLDYDILICDCPPGVEYLERLGLVASNIALVCTDAHPLAVIGASRVINDLEIRKQKGRRGPNSWALVLSRIDLRRTMDKALDEQLEQAYPNLERFMIRQDTSLAWASAERIPLMDYAPTGKATNDIKLIGDWIHAQKTQ